MLAPSPFRWKARAEISRSSKSLNWACGPESNCSPQPSQPERLLDRYVSPRRFSFFFCSSLPPGSLQVGCSLITTHSFHRVCSKDEHPPSDRTIGEVLDQSMPEDHMSGFVPSGSATPSSRGEMARLTWVRNGDPARLLRFTKWVSQTGRTQEVPLRLSPSRQ